MYPVLILREELVCLIILCFLAFISRSYRLGTDGKLFGRLLLWAMIHAVLDAVTVWTVNHAETVPRPLNYALHVVFYLSAMLYASEIFVYVVHLFYPRKTKQWHRISLVLLAVYVLLLPFLNIEFEPFNGTYASTGTAAYVGYSVAYLYFFVSLVLIFRNWKKLHRHIRLALLPMLLILVAAETAQILVREFLFTGGAVTAVTVGFFFSLENPTIVLERKFMMDAMTGVKSRSSYERDMLEFDRQYKADPDRSFIFLFIDIYNLKSVNGMYGHQAGDEYISFIAVILLNNLKGAEHIYRMGGDEFMAIYRDSDVETVIRDIQKVREACAREGSRLPYPPELSMGYAVSSPQYKNLHDVLRVADYMMYRHKADLKHEAAVRVGQVGTRLNLTGLTDRLFDAMCLSSDRYYPYMQNLETGVTRISSAMSDYFGLNEEFFADFAPVWLERIHPDDRQAYQEDLVATLRGKKRYHYCAYRVRDKAGNYVQVTCRGGVYHSRDGEADIFSGYVVNHGKPQTVDSITGLDNFTALYNRLEGILQIGMPAIIMRIEVSNLLRVRMIYGKESELTLLKQLADTILKVTQEQGRVYSDSERIYGIVLPTDQKEAAENLYGRLRAVCAEGITVGRFLIPVSLSASAVCLPDQRLGEKEEIRSALLYAMEKSRYEQHHELVFFQSRPDGLSGSEMRLLTRIHQDCLSERKHFVLHYQPIFDLKTGRLTGAETLLRWHSPESGEVPPGKFISFLENDPGYRALGYDIIRRSVRWAGKILETVPGFRISVNITALQLYDKDFVSRILRILEEERFRPENLMLELTERCKEMEFDDLSSAVRELREKGILVALDDVGTGFSTISLLLHLQVDEMKLDASFTRELSDHPNNRLYAKVLCEAAAANDRLDICFEGVEDLRTAEDLRSFGDVLVQGFYYDRPMPPEAFEKKYITGTAAPAPASES